MLILLPLLDRASGELRRRYSGFMSCADPSGSDYGEITFKRNQRSLDRLPNAKTGPPGRSLLRCRVGRNSKGVVKYVRHRLSQVNATDYPVSQMAPVTEVSQKIILRFLTRFLPQYTPIRVGFLQVYRLPGGSSPYVWGIQSHPIMYYHLVEWPCGTARVGCSRTPTGVRPCSGM